MRKPETGSVIKDSVSGFFVRIYVLTFPSTGDHADLSLHRQIMETKGAISLWIIIPIFVNADIVVL